MAVTLKDVAREAGVHVSTASRALNPATRSVVNQRTAGRVISAAKRLGYSPHPLARGLRTNRTWSVGTVVPNLMNPQFSQMSAGAEAALSEVGYSLLIVEARDDRNEDWEGAMLSERRVDGLILSTARLDLPPPRPVVEQGIPTVLLNRSNDTWPFPSVTGDDHAGIGLAVRHLTGLGHVAIAHVAGPQFISTGLNRRQAFFAWMSSEGLAPGPELIVEAEAFEIEAGRIAAEKLLDSGVPVTAIIAANDLIALGCIDGVRARGMEVPDDVSIVGYNNMNFTDRVSPSLTTVSIDYREMGAAAAQTLIEGMADRGSAPEPPTSIRFRPQLLARDSTAAVH